MSNIKRYYENQLLDYGPKLSPERLENLAGQLWPDDKPVMVGPVSHFTGEYPRPEGCNHKTCKSRWVIRGKGQTAESFSKVTFSNWRGFTSKKGFYYSPCPHCEHQRVMEFVNDIEAIANKYDQLQDLKWSRMTNQEAKRQKDKWRQDKSRKGKVVNQTSFPINGGETILFHDDNDINGQPLPTDRTELYNLVRPWVLNTPEGKRAGYGIGSWGEEKPEKEKPTNKGKPLPDDRKKVDKRSWAIMGNGYANIARKVGLFTGQDVFADFTKLDVKVDKVAQFLEEIGADYAVINGPFDELVTLKRGVSTDTPKGAKCDNDDIRPGDKGAKEKRIEPIQQDLGLEGVNHANV